MASRTAVPADPPPMPHKAVNSEIDSDGNFVDQQNPSAPSNAQDSSSAPVGAENGPSQPSPVSPSEAAKGASSGRELLRRLSLMGSKVAPSTMTRPEEHADLRLSGRIISAAFCIPYKLRFRTGLKWVCPTKILDLL